MTHLNRRGFLRSSAAFAAAGVGLTGSSLFAAAHDGIPRGERATQDPSVVVLNPRDRSPLSFIIDDSTCLVNMGAYCMPQFAATYPTREEYKKPWQTWPREIPDSFVRAFGEWCGEQGVKGKYSIVPYPACVGWLDRELPGWSRGQLRDSLQLVRELMVPSWDIHPEMVTHTRMIDIKTGRPFEEQTPATMENSYPQEKKSADELAAYLAYALRILKNCDLPCEGITTPGGFGNAAKPELSLAVHDAVRDVYGVEIPHYFKYIVGSGEIAQPVLEHVRGLGGGDVKTTVNVVAGTGDWFGGWDGDRAPEPDKYITRDGASGRMVELLNAGEPAIFFGHWAGLYSHGTQFGFRAFQQVVSAINEFHGSRTVWMKVSDIARYWAARGLTGIQREGRELRFDAPFACPAFTVRADAVVEQAPRCFNRGRETPLQETRERRSLQVGTFLREGNTVVLCFDLPKGPSHVQL
jgi:hypothetical protein